MNKILKFIVPILLFSGYVHTADVNVEDHITDFSGGLNNTNPSIYLNSNESPNMLNVEIDNPVGVLKQRKGYVHIGTAPTSNPIAAMYEYTKANGDRALILSDNVTVWSTFDGVAFTTITTGLSSLNVPFFKTIRDKLWIINGSTHPISWDGTTANPMDGTGSEPNPENANYIEYFKERVWLARTGTEPSSVYFSALTDIDGIDIDPSVSSQAWIATNAMHISEEDGSPIYAIKAYKDNLFVFKETGIWKIVFESELNIQLVKQVTNTGCKFQDSIVEMDDGLLYFLGPDGIYAFDGYNALRITDNIQSTINSLKQPFGAEKYKLWGTPTDFIAGTLLNVNTYYLDTYLSLNSITGPILYDNFNDSNFYYSPVWSTGTASTRFENYGNKLVFHMPTVGDGGKDETHILHSATTTLNFGNWSASMHATIQGFATSPTYETIEYFFVSSSTSPSTTSGYSIEIDGVSILGNRDGALPFRINKYLNGAKSTLATKTKSNCYTNGGYECNDISITISPSGMITSSDTTGDCSLSIQDGSFAKSSSNYQIVKARVKTVVFCNATYHPTIDDISIAGLYYPSGTFTSEITTFTSLSQWRTFDVNETLNGESIVFSVRTGTDVASANSATWNTIVQGQQISTETTHVNGQWRASLTSADATHSPLIDRVAMNYRIGDTTVNRVTALNYKNRYHISASTSPSNQFNDMVLVKSKSPSKAFAPLSLDISSWAMWNGYFYGSISDSADIVRLDYGNNDDGVTIDSFWESKDDVFQYPYYYKQINEILVDYEKGNNVSLYIGASVNGGNDYTTRSWDTNIASFNRDIKRFLYNMPLAPSFRLKISNTLYDQPYTIYGLHLFGKGFDYKGK